MTTMNLAAQQLIRAIRGKRSQAAFARKLGYRANPLTDWEHGRSYPTAEEALRAAERAGIQVSAAFARFAPDCPIERSPSGYHLGRWVRAVSGETASELARRVGRSRSALSRWLNEESKPRLPQFLELMDASTGRAHDWVAELVDIEQVPSLAARHRASNSARRLAFDAPWTEAVLRALETPAYASLPRHDTTWIAALLGLDAPVVQRCLESIENAGLARWDGRHYGEFRPLTVDTSGGKGALRALKTHWATVAAQRISSQRPGDLFAYNVLSAAETDLERIRTVLLEAYREVRAIVAASDPPERVALVNVQLMRF